MQSAKPEQQDAQPDRLRRRLARGGLGGTVILGSLISKPVLGAVPYNCTISGQLSGNTSTHGDPVSCSTLGSSRAFWLGALATAWSPVAGNVLVVGERFSVTIEPGAGPRYFRLRKP